MIETGLLITFLVSAILLIISPGIDTVFVLNKTISQGKRSGIYATLGICSGILVHTLFAAMGLSLIISQSAIAFSIIKYAGAIYLIYLGISQLRHNNKFSLSNQLQEKGTQEKDYKSFISGTLTNVLNPKVAIFFVAFFPQFITPQSNSIPQILLLGTIYSVSCAIWLSSLVILVSLFSSKLINSRFFNLWADRIAGATYIFLGIKLAFANMKK